MKRIAPRIFRFAGPVVVAGCLTVLLSTGAAGQGANVGGPKPSPSFPISSAAEYCRNLWKDAPAYQYCSNADVSPIMRIDELTGCKLEGWCFITVKVGGEAKAYNRSISDASKLPEVSLLDLCFNREQLKEGGDYVYSIRFRSPCLSGETDSATAVEQGLPRN